MIALHLRTIKDRLYKESSQLSFIFARRTSKDESAHPYCAQAQIVCARGIEGLPLAKNAYTSPFSLLFCKSIPAILDLIEHVAPSVIHYQPCQHKRYTCPIQKI